MITATLHFHCETCGQQITLHIHNSEDGTYRMEHTYACQRPAIKIMTINPRKLGVIYGETE